MSLLQDTSACQVAHVRHTKNIKTPPSNGIGFDIKDPRDLAGLSLAELTFSPRTRAERTQQSAEDLLLVSMSHARPRYG